MEDNKKVRKEKNKKEKSNKIFLFIIGLLLVAVMYAYDKVLWRLWGIIEKIFN